MPKKESRGKKIKIDHQRKRIAVLDIVKKTPLSDSLAESKKAKPVLIHPKNKRSPAKTNDFQTIPYSKMKALFRKRNKAKLEKLKKIQFLVKKSKRRKANLKKSQISSKIRYFLFAFIALVSIITFLSIFLFLPKAETKISLEKKPIRENLEIIISAKNLDTETLLPFILGNFQEKNKTAKRIFKASGKKILSSPAQGEVVLKNFNTFEQILVQRTRLLSPEGLIFRTKKRIVLPRAVKDKKGSLIPQAVRVQVEAEKTGEQGNLPAEKFRIATFVETNDPRAKTITVENPEPFTGGKQGEQNVVSENDLAEAKKVMQEEIKRNLIQELQNILPAGEKLLPGAIKVEAIKMSSDKQIGEPAENFEVKAEAKLFFATFDEAKIISLAQSFLKGKIDQDKTLIQDIKNGLSYQVKSFDQEKKQILLNLTLENKIEGIIDPEEIKHKIKGKTLDEAKKIILSNKEVKAVEFILSPFWVKKIPNFSERIQINLN